MTNMIVVETLGPRMDGNAAARYFKPVRDRISRPFKKSNRLSPTNCAELPPEVWMSILSYLSKREDIVPLTLTCQTLRLISQPVLFSKLVLHPFPDSDILSLDRAVVMMSRNRNGLRKRFIQKLDFCLSPRVSHAVLEIVIAPKKGARIRKPSDELLDMVFAGLESFHNLQRMECSCVPFTPSRIAILQRLTLNSLVLDSCCVDTTSSPELYPSLHPVPIRNIAFGFSAKTDTLDVIATRFYTSLLHPQTLRHLISSSTVNILAIILAAGCLHNLRELDIPVECTTSSDFLPALTNCPNLRRLSIRPSSSLSPHAPAGAQPVSSLPAELVPLITHYKGPRILVGQVATHRPLQALDISPKCSSERLNRTFTRLMGAGVSRSLESLTIRLTTLHPGTLPLINSVFINLRSLTIKGIFLPGSEWLELFENMDPHPQLRSLRFCAFLSQDPYNGALWKGYGEEVKEILTFINGLHGVISTKYPLMKKVQVMYDQSNSGCWVTLRRRPHDDPKTRRYIAKFGDFGLELGTPPSPQLDGLMMRREDLWADIR